MNERKLFQMALTGVVLLVGLTALLGGRLASIDLLPDQGASWYYWKLPTRTFWPMLTAWGFYALHQAFIWWGIYRMQHFKEERPRLNRLLLIGNGFFILLHLLQSQVWYDGLAQDVPVFSSQGSVIGMLILVLIMENNRRGIFLGKKLKGFNLVKAFVLKYHGYYIAWAITYTFWYHPMVSTSGHLVGFFYLFLLFVQASMAYTKWHTQKNWIFILEVLVLFHGTTVAIGQGNNMWPMFGFGFGFIAVFTQIYSLNLKKGLVSLIQVLYLVGALIVYGGGIAGKSLSGIHQITWIPVIEYGLVFVVLFLGEPILKTLKGLKTEKQP